MLIKEYLARENKEQNELAEFIGIDKQEMSRIVNYKCLPLPEQAEKICEFLNCNILDLYNRQEIDLIKGVKKASRIKDDNLYYRLSVRLNRSCCNLLKVKNLQLVGYETQKQWVVECLKDLKERQRQARKEIRSKSNE